MRDGYQLLTLARRRGTGESPPLLADILQHHCAGVRHTVVVHRRDRDSQWFGNIGVKGLVEPSLEKYKRILR